MTVESANALHVVRDVKGEPSDREIQLEILNELRALNQMLTPLAEMAKMRMPLAGFKLPLGRK